MANDLDFDRIAELLRDEHGLDAYVEQTGGGCATLYVGPYTVNADDPQITWPAISAGPGWFTGPDWTGAKVSTSEFFCGPGNPDHPDYDEPVEIGDTDEAGAAAKIALIHAAV